MLYWKQRYGHKKTRFGYRKMRFGYKSAHELMGLLQLAAVVILVLAFFFVVSTLVGGINQALAETPALLPVSDASAVIGAAGW